MKICLALDCSDLSVVQNLLPKIIDYIDVIKLGPQFVLSHPDVAFGFWPKPLFFDFKFHDIPNTVANSLAAIQNKADYATIHLGASEEMIKAAVKAVEPSKSEYENFVLKTRDEVSKWPEWKKSEAALGIKRKIDSVDRKKFWDSAVEIAKDVESWPAWKKETVAKKHKLMILGVTVLTSDSDQDLQNIGIQEKTVDQVLKLARTGWRNGVRGFVCSGWEARMLRAEFPEAFLVTPGIRIDVPAEDQHRIMTPKQAKEAGSDMIVVGREVLNAINPRETIRKIRESL